MVAARLTESAAAFFAEEELPEDLGWADWLFPVHLRLFTGELYAAICFDATPEEIAALIDSWKGTAEMDHSPATREHIERNRDRRFTTVDEWRTSKRVTG